MLRLKVKVTRDKNGILGPFRRSACGLCFVKHFSSSYNFMISILIWQ